MSIGRRFDKNMFIMLLSIMIGVIIITYFVSDVIKRSELEELETGHTEEISIINIKNEQFTDHFMKSSVLLDSAREDRAAGNYNFDLAFLWYQSALSEKNETTMNTYKSRTILNCDDAMYNYTISSKNFEEANMYFDDTKAYTNNNKYQDILDIYISLTKSGEKLTLLRYNASRYLKQLAEKIIMDETGRVTYSENVSELLMLFNETLAAYSSELAVYDELKEEIDEYEFFDEIR